MSVKSKALSGVLWSGIDFLSIRFVQFILSFIIARQLVPQDYGLIAMLSLFLTISNLFIDSGFSSALVQKQNRDDADYSTCFYFNIVIGVVMYLVLLLISPYIASFYNQPILKDIILILGLTLIINSFSSVQKTILTIELNFKRQAFISFISACISGAIAVFMAYKGFGVWTLVLQSIFNSLLTTVLLWITSKWRPSLRFSLNSFKELFSFGSKLMASGLLHTIYKNLYTIVIGKVFLLKDLGLFNRADSITTFPSNNVSGVINKVAYPILCSASDNSESFSNILFSFIRLSAFVVFPLMAGLMVLAEPLILIVLTEKWTGCVPYIQIISIAYVWDTTMVFLGTSVNAMHRSDYFLKAEVWKKIAAVAFLFASIPLGVKAMCWSMVLYAFADMFIITRYTKILLPSVNLANVFKHLFPIILQTVIMGISVYICKSMFHTPLIQLCAGVAVGIIIYILLSQLICKNEFKEIFNLLKNIKS